MSNVADSLRSRVLSHTESSMIFSKNELLSLCEAIDNEVRSKQERMRERAAIAAEEADYPSEEMDSCCDHMCLRQSDKCAADIRALEVEDGEG